MGTSAMAPEDHRSLRGYQKTMPSRAGQTVAAAQRLNDADSPVYWAASNEGSLARSPRDALAEAERWSTLRGDMAVEAHRLRRDSRTFLFG